MLVCNIVKVVVDDDNATFKSQFSTNNFRTEFHRPY